MAEGDTLVNAVVGAVVGVLAGAVLPLGPLVGGLVAGYLEGGSRSDGLQVGFYAGVIAFVPLVVSGFGILAVLGIFSLGVGGEALAFGAMGLAILALVFVVAVAYILGLSVLGGWLGNYIRYETDIGD